MPDFLQTSEVDKLLPSLFKQLCLLDMEGKFSIRRPRFAGEQLARVDKFMDFSIASISDPSRSVEFAQLLELSQLLFFLPFEINGKIPLNLQVSE